MKSILLCLLLCLSSMNLLLAAPAKSFLKAKDHLVFIGDSLTEMGEYGRMLNCVIQQVYPDAGIKVVSHGKGGAKAGAAVPLLKEYLATNTPTLVFMMFGVNDTLWRNEDIDKKSAAFVDNLKKMQDFCVAKDLPLILIKESPFSHNLANDLWLSGVNTALDTLLNAQQEYATLHNIAVIDGYGFYKRNLSAAWTQNPHYEFSPDVVHPNSPGNAALSSSLIKALGIGLELSSGTRPELSTASSSDLQIEILDDLSVTELGQTIRAKVRIQNISRSEKKGSVTLLTSFNRPVSVVCSLPPLGSEIIEIPIVLPDVNTVSPLFVRFTTGTESWCSDTIIFAAPQKSLAEGPAAFTEKDFHLSIHQKGYLGKEEQESITSPVKALKISADKQTIRLNFNWDDLTPVFAKETTTSRVGKEVNAPVDILARAGAQKCDSIDFLLDLRSLKETGRPTADIDSVPDGVIKIVVFRQKTIKVTELKFLSYPENLSDRISIKETGKAIELNIESPKPFDEFSVMAFINDCFSEEKNNTACFILENGWPGDPMQNIRFNTAKKDNIFYRIGY